MEFEMGRSGKHCYIVFGENFQEELINLGFSTLQVINFDLVLSKLLNTAIYWTKEVGRFIFKTDDIVTAHSKLHNLVATNV